MTLGARTAILFEVGAVVVPVEEDDMRMGMITAAVLVALARVATAHNAQELTRAELSAEAAQNKALARYLRFNGMPDVAERHALGDQPPWDDHEVVLYYADMGKEISFSRARILGKPDVYTKRYERALTEADLRAIKSRAGVTDDKTADKTVTAATTCTGSAVERAECAAGRAESAADRIDAAAVRAEHAADRTEAIVAKMQAPVRHKRKS